MNGPGHKTERHTAEGGSTGSETSGRIRRRILLALGLIALALYWVWSATGQRRAIRALAPEQRAALYQSTRRALETACASPDPSLDEYCQTQARLLLDLPECDAACREFATQQLARGR